MVPTSGYPKIYPGMHVQVRREVGGAFYHTDMLLTKRPGPPDAKNAISARAAENAVGLVVAVVTVRNVIEACVLFSTGLGWNLVGCFKEVME